MILSSLSLASTFAADITIDARALTERYFNLQPGTGCLDATQVQQLTVVPGTYTFVGCYTGGALDFAVGQDGNITYDTSLQGKMEGAGTPALVVNGFSITLDSTPLSEPGYTFYGLSLSCVTGTEPQTWNLLPTTSYRYSYQVCPRASATSFVAFSFGVGLDGNITYDPSDYLEGVGTNRLLVKGFEILIDARALTEKLFELYGVLQPMDGSRVQPLRLLPSTYLFLNRPSISQFYFGVDATTGFVTYDPSLEGVVHGEGSRLTVKGFPITLDATNLTEPRFRVAGVTSCLNGWRPQTMQLLPGGTFTFVGCSSGASFSFSVGTNGRVDYSPALDLVVKGRAVDKTLRVVGAHVIVAPDVGFDKDVWTPLDPHISCAGRLHFTVLPEQYSVCVSEDTCYAFVVAQDRNLTPTEITTPYGRFQLLLGPDPSKPGDFSYRLKCDTVEPAYISGRVIVDLDENCRENRPDEVAVAAAKVRITSIPKPGQPRPTWYAWTGANGQYVAPLQSGDYLVELVPTSTIGPVCLQPHVVSVSPGAPSSGNDFYVRYRCAAVATLTATYGNPAVCNGRPIQSACPTARQLYCADFRNAGTVPILEAGPQHPVGRLTVDLADTAEFSGETVVSNTCPTTTSDSLTAAPNLSWDLQSALAPPGISCKICVELEVVACDNSYQPARLVTRAGLDAFCPPEPQSGTTNFIAVRPTTTLVDPRSGLPYEECKCSCDPNDKTVQPSGCGPEGFIGQDEALTYMIRFQNLGLTPALDVVVLDAIDPNLDPDTLEIVTTSHPYTSIAILPNNVLEWSFTGINLPHSTQDELGSQGFIIFRIRPRAGVPDGTEFINGAAIFFDQNAPEITNVTLNTVGPAQIADLDGDGLSPCQGDCNDLDPSVHPGAPEICDGKDNDCDGIVDGPQAAPGEVTGLSLGSDKATVAWDAGAAAYDVVHGALNELPVGGGASESCLASGTAATTAVDNSTPSMGRGFWYLVRATNACGVGSYGLASNGSERSSAACP
ncbi:MAG TPA: putative metal-binding motif-containing protein [Candidatus Polarisedimenticolia bacterium]|nr:putative metal-binding motif-containing protein [Candidatus Polarisedimenticolia bacterium]